MDAISLWGAREGDENGRKGFYNPEKNYFNQGEVSPDFAEQFEAVDAEKIGTTNFLDQEVLCLKGPNGQEVVCGVSANLAKRKDEIRALSTLMAKQGAGIVSTGSIRSKRWEGAPLPNLGAVNKEVQPGMVEAQQEYTGQSSLVNFFGVPSPELDEVLDALRISQIRCEKRNQILNVSLLATPYSGPETTLDEYVQDWVLLVERMRETGVKCVELNFSNPHIPKGHQSKCMLGGAGGACEGVQMPELIELVLEKCRESAPDMKIGIKLRHMGKEDSPDELDEELISEIINKAAPYIDFLTAINTNPTKVMDQNEEHYFGDSRPKAGVSGEMIQKLARNFITYILTLKEANPDYKFSVIATGGARDPESIQELVKLKVGTAKVDAVTAMSGLFEDGNLWAKYALV